MIELWLALAVAIFFTFTIKFKIIRDEDESRMYLYLTRILNIKIDVDKLIYSFSHSKYRAGFSVYESLENYKKMVETKDLIFDMIHKTVIKEIKIIVKTPMIDPEIDQYYKIANWTALTYLQNFINENFKEVRQEKYLVVDKYAREKRNYNFYCIGQIKLVHIIYSILKNVGEIITLMKRGSDYGTSNK